MRRGCKDKASKAELGVAVIDEKEMEKLASCLRTALTTCICRPEDRAVCGPGTATCCLRSWSSAKCAAQDDKEAFSSSPPHHRHVTSSVSSSTASLPPPDTMPNPPPPAAQLHVWMCPRDPTPAAALFQNVHPQIDSVRMVQLPQRRHPATATARSSPSRRHWQLPQFVRMCVGLYVITCPGVYG